MWIADSCCVCDGIHFVVPASWIELSLPLGRYLVWKKVGADYGDLLKICQSVFRAVIYGAVI